MRFEPEFDGTLVPYRDTEKEPPKPLKLTAKQCCAMYTYLCSLPPFSKWKMPDPYRISFKVSTSTMTCGMYEPDPHRITISKASNAGYDEALRTMAHEMLHCHLERTHGLHETHDENFWKHAAMITDSMGWDLKEF